MKSDGKFATMSKTRHKHIKQKKNEEDSILNYIVIFVFVVSEEAFLFELGFKSMLRRR